MRDECASFPRSPYDRSLLEVEIGHPRLNEKHHGEIDVGVALISGQSSWVKLRRMLLGCVCAGFHLLDCAKLVHTPRFAVHQILDFCTKRQIVQNTRLEQLRPSSMETVRGNTIFGPERTQGLSFARSKSNEVAQPMAGPRFFTPTCWPLSTTPPARLPSSSRWMSSSTK